jgi:hypothetical protein
MGRVEMMAKTIDLIGRWNKSPGPNGIGSSLIGRANLSKVGVMGHSRGGEGVNLFEAYNATRPTTAAAALDYTTPGTTPTATSGFSIPDYGKRYPLKAVFSLAPVDGQGGFRPQFDAKSATAWATALPYCDGDVFDLEGAPVFERNKSVLSANGHPAIQFLVAGANHNYFNTDWANDDAQLFDFGDPTCVADPEHSPTRLSKAEERRVGVALMGAFLRRYVGGETQFDPIMRGEAIPDSACPDEPLTTGGITCRDVYQTSYAAPAPSRRVLVAPADANLPTSTPAGDPVTLTGFVSAASCKPATLSLVGTTGCGASPNRSPVQQLSLSWAGPASLDVELTGAQRDVSPFRTLALRAATNFSSPLNPPSVEPAIEVSLTDSTGLTRTVLTDSFSPALQPAPGTTARKEVLNGVRIPLAAFTGIDLTRVTNVRLGFGLASPTGAVELTDLAFQEPAFVPGPEPDPKPGHSQKRNHS